MIRTTLGLMLIAAGVCLVVSACNTAPNHILFLGGLLALVLGWIVLPSEAQVQDQMRICNLAYRHRVTSGFSTGIDHRL